MSGLLDEADRSIHQKRVHTPGMSAGVIPLVYMPRVGAGLEVRNDPFSGANGTENVVAAEQMDAPDLNVHVIVLLHFQPRESRNATRRESQAGTSLRDGQGIRQAVFDVGERYLGIVIEYAILIMCQIGFILPADCPSIADVVQRCQLADCRIFSIDPMTGHQIRHARV